MKTKKWSDWSHERGDLSVFKVASLNDDLLSETVQVMLQNEKGWWMRWGWERWTMIWWWDDSISQVRWSDREAPRRKRLRGIRFVKKECYKTSKLWLKIEKVRQKRWKIYGGGGADEIRRRLDRFPTAAAPNKFDVVRRRNSTAQGSSRQRTDRRVILI